MTLSAKSIADLIFGEVTFEPTNLWEQIVRAHEAMCDLQFGLAIRLYETVLNSELFPKIFYQKLWDITPLANSPSLAGACIYLREYFIVRWDLWTKWMTYADFVLNDIDFKSIDDSTKSLFISSRGWALLFTSKTSLKSILDDQLAALESMNLGAIEQAHHYLLTGHIYQLLRQPTLSFSHINKANELFTEDNCQFYIYQSKRTLARAYFYLKNFGDDYSEKSLALFKEAFQMLLEVDPNSQSQYYYDLGWVYSENGDYDLAIEVFSKGYNLSYENNLDVELARHEWGLGRTYFLLRDYEEAVRLLRPATFCFELNHLSLMTAMCLQVEAACLQKLGFLDDAIELAHIRGLPLQRQIDDPVQLYHMLRRLVSLHCEKGDWYKHKQIYQEFFKIKRNLNK